MTDFSIQIDPPFPPGELIKTTPNIKWVYNEEIEKMYPTQYNIKFIIYDTLWCYYPSDLLSVFGDLHTEWDMTRRRQDHPVEICGYQILDVEFRDGMTYFYDLPWYGRPQRELIGGKGIHSNLVEQTIAHQMSHAWSLIEKVK